MRNIENNIEKLTATVSKSYHGNMTENGDKQPERESEIPLKELVKDGKNPDVRSVDINAGVRPVEKRVDKATPEKRGEAFDWNKLTEEEKEKFVKVKKRLEGGADMEKEPGLFDILMDILKALFGIDDKEAGKIIDNSEAMRGVQAYWRIKPQNKWEENDYARVIFMLNGDGSKEATAIKDKLYKDAEESGIKKEKVLAKNAEIEGEHSESLPREGEFRAISEQEKKQERKEEMTHRAIAMNADLLEEMGSKKLSELSENDLIRFEGAIETLTVQGEYEAQDQKAKDALLKNTREAKDARMKSDNKKKEHEELFKEANGAGDWWTRVAVGGAEGAGDSTGKKDKETVVDKGSGGGEDEKPVSIMNDKELQAHYLKLINKNTGVLPEILQVNKDMLAELIEIRKGIDKLVGSYMNTLVDYPDLYRKNPEKYMEMRRDYVAMRGREMEIQTHLEKFTKGEKRVLGGEKDKRLYVGNIDEVLEERMKRIEYFTARKAKGEIDWGKLGKDSVLNPDASGIKGEEKSERQEFLDGMKVRYGEFEKEGILAKQEGLYFQEIQRWVGEILENSQYGTRGDRKHDLILPNDAYKEFGVIKDMKAYVYEHGSQKEYEKKLLEKVRILRNKKFLDYFKDEKGQGVSYLNFEGKDITRETGEIGRASMGYPSSIEATMLLIAEDRGAEYRTGAEHELIDASGKFHQENFIYWMRKEMNKLTDWDPWSPIDPMRGITFKAGFSQISLFDILFLPQYTQHQEIEIHGRVNDKGDPDVHSNWGEKKDHPDMDYDTRVNRILIDEPWLYGIEHNDYVQLYNYQARSNPEKYLEVKGQIAQSNNYVRSGLWLRRLMLPSHSGHGGKDTENYLKDKKQGKMGEADIAGDLFYRYFTDFTEKYLDINEEGKATGVRENNMAYNALDIDGSSVFLMSIAESALGMADVGARKEIKKAYGNFILDRIGQIEEKYEGQGDEGKKKILIEKCRKEVEKLRDEDQDKLKISFDTFDKLTDLQMKMETVVLKKTVVSAEEKKKYNLKEDKVVVKKEEEKKVKGKMRENIGVFLTDVMEIKIPEANDRGKFDLDEKGKPKRTKKIGDFEIFMDGNGRIVTEKEWEEMDDKGKIKKTFGQIMTEDLGADKKGFARDSSKLEDYGQAVSDFEKAMEEGKETKSIEEKIARLGGECRGVFERRERLGLAMLTKVANIERKTLNFWTTTRPWEDSARKLVKDALMKTIGVTYDLDSHEQLYAHDRIWYPMEYTEVAAFNNTSRVIGGIQMGAQYSQLDDARKNYQGLSTMGGSLETIDEMKSLRLPSLFERLKIKKRGEGLPGGIPQHSLIEIMQGGDGAVMKPRWDRRIEDNPDEVWETPKDWEHADVIDGLSHIEKLRKLIVEEDPDIGSFHEIVTINAWGVQKVDYVKARKLFDAYWNHARLTFGSHQIDYDKKIWAHGREMSVRDYFFGERTKETQDRMEKYYVEMADKATKKGKAEDTAAYKSMASDIKNKPALAFVMNMVTSGIHEHMTFDSPYEMWSTQHVQEIAWIMEKSFRQVADDQQGRNGEHKKGLEPAMKPSMMPYELFNRLLGVQEGDSMDKFMFWDLFRCLAAGCLAGLGEAQKEIEDELKGQVPKTWIG